MERHGPLSPTILRLALSLCLLGAVLPGAAHATERGASHYSPGGTRSFAVAVNPPPGLRLESETRIANGRHDLVGSTGTVPRAETLRITELLGGFYRFEGSLLGGHVEVGARLPFGYVRTNSPSIHVVERFDIGDLELAPLAWYWSRGQLHLSVREKVFAPTGGFSSSRPSDIGLNYWSFDSIVGATWFNEGSGTEISVEAGLLTHTRNGATKYKTGKEFHVDFMLNQFWTPHFAFGGQGYYYNQVSNDPLAGTPPTRVEANAIGFGPAILWTPETFDRKLRIVASWIRDLHATDRSDGAHARLTFTFTPGG
jgi:hypothetical protein